jgi:hypothetical protein
MYSGLVLIADKKERPKFFFADDTLDVIPFIEGPMAVDVEDLMSGAE